MSGGHSPAGHSAPPQLSPRERAIAWSRQVVANPRTAYLDTETTGLGDDAEIVDIALVTGDGRVLLDTLVKPVRPIPPEASAVHGITNEMIALDSIPTWDVLYPIIAPLLGNHRVVIYNAQYDLKIIDQCCRAAGFETMQPAIADCAMLEYSAFDGTAGKYGSLKWHKLDAAAARFGIDPGGHRALADAEVCRQVVLAMAAAARSCRVCGCTDDDCQQCVEAQGRPCSWVEPDLCSRCAAPAQQLPETPVQVADRLWQQAFGRPPR